MIRHILILPPAATDVAQAFHGYNDKAAGLGRAFLADLHFQLTRISQIPDSYPLMSETSRRSHLQRFPHTIVYKVHTSHIHIVAVIHHRSYPQTTQD